MFAYATCWFQFEDDEMTHEIRRMKKRKREREESLCAQVWKILENLITHVNHIHTNKSMWSNQIVWHQKCATHALRVIFVHVKPHSQFTVEISTKWTNRISSENYPKISLSQRFKRRRSLTHKLFIKFSQNKFGFVVIDAVLLLGLFFLLLYRWKAID